MERRQALKHVLRSLAVGGLCSPAALWAQGGPGTPGVAQTGPGAGAPAGQMPRPAVQVVVDPELQRILQWWERYTKSISRLHGEFDRYVYDGTFLVEKRAVGEFWYEAPDQGRIDFLPAPANKLPQPNANGQRLNPKKTGPSGQPYVVQADISTRWICRGDALLYIDLDQKTCEIMDIPPHMQGKNITMSPLPFLFGMSAQEMTERYYLGLGERNDPEGKRGAPMIHIIASPKQAAAAQEWKRAEVLLDPGTRFKDGQGQPVFVPAAIKLIDPTDQQETVYAFNLANTKLNPNFFVNPFKNPGLLSGIKVTAHHKVPAENEIRTAEQPR